MRYKDRVRYENEFDYLNRAYIITRNRLEKERRQRAEDIKDKWATAAVIVAAGIAFYFMVAAFADFGHWLTYGWR